MSRLRRNCDWALLAVILGGFVFIASQRLDTVPVPEGDEAFMSQVAYEMVYHNKIAVPLLRYLGGNIENAWHCRTPVYFLLMGGFHKVFGYGLAEGRAFNLTTAILTLLMVYIIGRQLFNWRVGLISVVMLIADQTFLERSRLLRNDYTAAAFALLAFYLYEVAVQRKSLKYYAASGLAAGAGVMSHTNILYLLGAISLLILFNEGWKGFVSKKLYCFLGSAFLVMAYQIIYDIVDYKNFLLQNRQDKLHFQVLERWGWWDNIVREPVRYMKWNAGGVMLPNVPQTLLHLFQLLTVIAVFYLMARWARGISKGSAGSDLRNHFLLVTLIVVLFLAVVSGNKDIYYLAHLAPWFALCVGIMLSDSLDLVGRLRISRWRWAKPAYQALFAVSTLAVLAYGYQFARQSGRYLREVRNPTLASFGEIKGILREVIPDGLCPVAVKLPVIWLAFPEKDSCFATIEQRMLDALDIDGNNYALLLRRKNMDFWPMDLDKVYHLIGQLTDTPYGTLLIYYTGTDRRYLEVSPKRYQFFSGFRGHVSDEQIAAAREIWTVGMPSIEQPSNSQELIFKPPEPQIGTNTLLEISSINLTPGMIYQVRVDATSGTEWQLVIVDERTGAWFEQIGITGEEDTGPVEQLFRNPSASRVKLAVRPLKTTSADSIRISRISIREVGHL